MTFSLSSWSTLWSLSLAVWSGPHALSPAGESCSEVIVWAVRFQNMVSFALASLETKHAARMIPASNLDIPSSCGAADLKATGYASPMTNAVSLTSGDKATRIKRASDLPLFLSPIETSYFLGLRRQPRELKTVMMDWLARGRKRNRRTARSLVGVRARFAQRKRTCAD